MVEHRVVNEFILDDTRIITLDNKRSFDELGTKKIVVDGKTYSYELTHNEFMFVIDTTESLLDKTVRFIT